MLRRFATGSAEVEARIYGISYKCEVFEVCDSTPPAHSVAELIGPFDASNEAFTMRYIVEWMSRFFDAETFAANADALVCTSPFVLCGVVHALSGLPLIGYLGLPLLWKAPVDFAA